MIHITSLGLFFCMLAMLNVERASCLISWFHVRESSRRCMQQCRKTVSAAAEVYLLAGEVDTDHAQADRASSENLVH